MLNYKLYFLNKNRDYIVFLHGLMGDSSNWKKQIEFLKNDYNIIAIDFHKNVKISSSEFFNNYTIDNLSNEIISILDEHSIKRTHFVGMSLGSIVVHSLIKKQPERIKSVIQAGSIVDWNLFSKIILWLVPVVKYCIPYSILSGILVYSMLPLKKHKSIRASFYKNIKKTPKEIFFSWIINVTKIGHYFYDSVSNLKEIPNIYISGSTDFLLLPKLKRNIDKKKHLNIIVLKGASHVCNLDSSKEFNSVMKDFLSQLNYEG